MLCDATCCSSCLAELDVKNNLLLHTTSIRCTLVMLLLLLLQDVDGTHCRMPQTLVGILCNAQQKHQPSLSMPIQISALARCCCGAAPASCPPDFLVNVQMLLWGAKHVGPPNAHTALRMDTDPAAAWRDMAISHARATAKNHLRPDGSSYHVVEYNPENRPPFINKRYTYQGYADESVWARGQSWALLGFALMYAETGLPEFLDTAKKVTDRWLQLLAAQPGAPGGFVPLWDYSAPFDPARDGPRDSSAAGIASLALLTLAEVVGTDSMCGQRYLCAGVRTLAALAGPKYLAQPGEGFAALFKHAVANFPDSYGVDVGIIYGDYYGLSAFAKCAQMQACREYVL